MKKEFTAYCFNASGSAAKRVKIEVTNYSYNGAPVANIWTAPTPFDSFEIYVEFRGILVYYRTFSPDTLERENVAGLLARVGSEFLELVTSGRVYPSFPVLAALQAVGSPEELAAAVEAREAVQKYERERDEERERERVEAERREREREERERVEAIQDAKEKVLQGDNITGLQLVYLLHHYGVTVHPRTLHNIHEVQKINGVTLSYNRPASGRKMKVDTIFEVFADVAGRIKDEAKRERVEAPAVAVDQVPAPVAVPEAVEAPAVAGVACSFTVAGSLEAEGLTGAPYEHSEKSQIFMNPGEVYKTAKANRYIIILSDDGDKIRTTDAVLGRFSGNIDKSDKESFLNCLEAGSIIKADASQLPPVTDVHTWRESLENGYGDAFQIRTELIYAAADAMTETEKADTAARMGFALPLDPLAVMDAAALHKWNASRGNYKNCAALEWLVTQQDEPTAFQMNAGAYPVIFADYARRI